MNLKARRRPPAGEKTSILTTKKDKMGHWRKQKGTTSFPFKESKEKRRKGAKVKRQPTKEGNWAFSAGTKLNKQKKKIREYWRELNQKRRPHEKKSIKNGGKD